MVFYVHVNLSYTYLLWMFGQLMRTLDVDIQTSLHQFHNPDLISNLRKTKQIRRQSMKKKKTEQTQTLTGKSRSTLTSRRAGFGS